MEFSFFLFIFIGACFLSAKDALGLTQGKERSSSDSYSNNHDDTEIFVRDLVKSNWNSYQETARHICIPESIENSGPKLRLIKTSSVETSPPPFDKVPKTPCHKTPDITLLKR